MNQDHSNHQLHASDQPNAAQQTPENHTTKGNTAQLVETLEVLEGFCKEQEEKEWARRLIVLCSVTKVMLRREERAENLKEENQRLENDNQRLENENQCLRRLVAVMQTGDVILPTLFEEFEYGEALGELEKAQRK